MEEKSMDDKLYYVESNRGQILGPLNMILILEGIAAGRILETARICEVGQEQWISLSDVAYTHEHHEETDEIAEAGAPPQIESSAPASEELVLGGLELQLEPLSPSAPLEEELPKTSATESVLSNADEIAPRGDVSFLELDDATATPAFDEAPSLEAEPSISEPAMEVGEPVEREVVEEAPRPITSYGDIELPAATLTFGEDVSAGATESEVPEATETVSFHAPDEEFTPRFAGPAEPEPGDFHPNVATKDLEEFVRLEPAPKKNGKKWITSVAVAIAVPAIAGAFVLAGGKIPFLEGVGPIRSIIANSGDEAGALDRGRSLLAAGRQADAIAEFRRAVTANPNSAEAHHGLGRAALQSGKMKLALRHLQAAVTLEPNGSGYRLDLAQGLLKAGDSKAAEETARALLSLDPEEHEGHLLLGRALLEQGDPVGAVQEIATYVEAAPEHRRARFELANALARSGRVDAAITEVEAFLEQAPEHAQAHRSRVEWMIALGQDAEAAALYKKLATENPESSARHYGAGIAHPFSDEGIAFLNEATRLDPKNANAFATLGAYLESRGDVDGAALALKRATEIEPGIAERYLKLAEAAPPAETRPSTPRKKPVATPKRSRPTSELANRLDAVQQALDQEDFAGARDLLVAARSEFQSNRQATRAVKLWEGIVEFEAGNLDEAAAKFDALDPNANYEVAGWDGARIPSWDVRNWAAWCHIARGDVRSAVRFLDGISPKNPDEYALAKLWEGMALSSLGMNDLAVRTWDQIALEMADRVGPPGQAAVKSAQYLIGAISEKDYRNAVAPIPGFENDMHFFLGHVASRERNLERARAHFSEAVDVSQGREFPFHLAQTKMAE